MADQGLALGTFFGSTVALTTNTTLLGNVHSITTTPEFSRGSVETTHLATTSGWKTFISGDIKDGGSIAVNCYYNTNVNLATLFETGCDTITITFTKRGTSCGAAVATTAATWAASVVLEKISPTWPNDGALMVTYTFKISGKPTIVAAVV